MNFEKIYIYTTEPSVCNMFKEYNDTLWLENMRLFCEELDVYLSLEHTDFPSATPLGPCEDFGNLYKVSTDCTYASEIDHGKHDAKIFDIQSMARKLLVSMGRHPAIKFRGDPPFFEKALCMALTLAVEHQDVCKRRISNKTHLLGSVTTCS